MNVTTEPEVGIDPHLDLVRFLREQDELSMDNTTKHMVEQIDAAKVGRSIVYPLVVMTKKSKISIGDHSRVDDFAKLEGGSGLTIGDRVHIASFAHVNIGGGVTIIKDGAAMASGAKTITGGNLPDSISCSAVADKFEQVLSDGAVILEKNSCLYVDAVVYSGPGKTVVIGEGSRVIGKSFVTKSIPPGEIWGGAPAKFIRKVTL